MLPLQGIRVVEIAQNLAGPYCAEILAHLGADVIKVERPEGGDDTRGWGPPFLDGAGTSFHAVNLGKRSVARGPEGPAGRGAIARADRRRGRRGAEPAARIRGSARAGRPDAHEEETRG